MKRIESTLQVPKPVESVFAFMSAAENHARFIPNMAEFKQTSDSSFGKVGATAEGRLNYFDILHIQVPYEIIECEPNRAIAMKGKMGPIQFQDGYILSAADQGTMIRFWLELNLTGWTVLLRPLAGLIGQIHAYETLSNLKRELKAIH